MSEKDNSVPQLPFEIERQARIKRSIVIRACVRSILRAFAERLRIVVWLARRPAAKRRICSDIRELQQFDDRVLADIGVTTDRGGQFDGQIAAVNAQILSRARLLSIVAFRLCAAATICLVTAGTTVAESATIVSPLCAAADLRLITLIESHGEAQDVAPENLGASLFHCNGGAQGLPSGADRRGDQTL